MKILEARNFLFDRKFNSRLTRQHPLFLSGKSDCQSRRSDLWKKREKVQKNGKEGDAMKKRPVLHAHRNEEKNVRVTSSEICTCQVFGLVSFHDLAHRLCANFHSVRETSKHELQKRKF